MEENTLEIFNSSSLLWFNLFFYFGTMAGAVSGALIAGDNNLDMVGTFTLAGLSGLGGGIVRDVIIGSTPPLVFVDYSYFLIVFGSALATYFFYNYLNKMEKWIVIADALGMACMIVFGMEKAVAYGLSTIPSLLIGLITSTVGGVLRDITVNRIPYLFKKEMYLVYCLLGSLIFIFLKPYVPRLWLYPLVVGVVSTLRIIGYFKRWSLPLAKEYKF